MCECVVVTQLTTVAHSFGNVHLKHTLTTCTFSIPHNISGLTMGHAKLFHFHVTEKKCSLFFVLFVFKSFLSHKKQYKRDEKFFLPLLYYSMIVMMSEVYVWKGSFLYAVHVENNEKISFYKLNVISEWVEIFFHWYNTMTMYKCIVIFLVFTLFYACRGISYGYKYHLSHKS